MSSEAADRHGGGYRHWDMLECGWKYNMDNIHASLLIPQIPKIERNWAKRSELYAKYLRLIEEIPGISHPAIVKGSKSGLHLFTIWVEQQLRDTLVRRMGEAGIGITVNYRAIHLLRYFREKFGFERGMFPVAERIGDSTISLPFYPDMPEEEMILVVKTIEDILRQARADL